MRATFAAAIDGAADRRRRLALRLLGLYAVTPDLTDTADLVVRVGAVVAGGATAVQYRHKMASRSLRETQARALAQVLRGKALFIVNDDPQLAAAVDADGVHLGEGDGNLAAARAIVGPERLIGVSCYNELARAEAAVAAGADYVAFGSFFPSVIKPDARRADMGLLRQSARLNVPVVAIGGIDAHNAPQLMRAGAAAVAVISAVFGVDDAKAAALLIATAIADVEANE